MFEQNVSIPFISDGRCIASLCRVIGCHLSSRILVLCSVCSCECIWWLVKYTWCRRNQKTFRNEKFKSELSLKAKYNLWNKIKTGLTIYRLYACVRAIPAPSLLCHFFYLHAISTFFIYNMNLVNHQFWCPQVRNIQVRFSIPDLQFFPNGPHMYSRIWVICKQGFFHTL